MSLIDFHLSMPYHYITKVHFPIYSSKSLSSFMLLHYYSIFSSKSRS